MQQYQIDDFAIYEFSKQIPVSTVIFFAHANGVPALTYRVLFEKLVEQSNCKVISYDMRGIGHTPLHAGNKQMDKKDWVWGVLLQDHITLFKKIRAQHPAGTKFILAGHSIGAWLSLLSAHNLKIKKPLLFEPAILPMKVAVPWFLLRLVGYKHAGKMSQKARRRKRQYQSFEEIFQKYSNSMFMKHWPPEAIKDYIQSSFSYTPDKQQVLLNHDPNWEGTIFEEYPHAASIAFLRVPFRYRLTLKPVFYAGEYSGVCNLNAKNWVRLFFPQLQWHVAPKGRHMFPLEQPDVFIRILRKHVSSQ